MNSDGSLIYLPSGLPNRISYAFNLKGPSIAIDTACSSSLTGLHLATSAIKNGDCTAALVGAAQSNRKLVVSPPGYEHRCFSSNPVFLQCPGVVEIR